MLIKKAALLRVPQLPLCGEQPVITPLDGGLNVTGSPEQLVEVLLLP